MLRSSNTDRCNTSKSYFKNRESDFNRFIPLYQLYGRSLLQWTTIKLKRRYRSL